MASIELHSYRHHGSYLPSRWTFGLASLVERLKLWHAVARERRHLRSLDDDRLIDLGLSRSIVEREACRPFWDNHGLDAR